MDEIAPDNSAAERSEYSKPADQPYHPPQLIFIGKAADLIQSGSGKHTDDYSGWYWSSEN